MRTKRNHFRVEYPSEVRPLVHMRGRIMPVINLSEAGILFTVNDDFDPAVGKTLKAEVIFEDQEKFAIIGKVLRCSESHIAMHLSQGIPLQRIMSEQRSLLTRYGTLKEPDPEHR